MLPRPLARAAWFVARSVLGGIVVMAGVTAIRAEDGATGRRAEIEAMVREGRPDAQYALGRLLETEEDGDRDYRQAMSLYCRAARKGHAEAAYRVSRLYMFGQGAPIDPVMTIAWLRIAAELGQLEARRLVDLLPPGGARRTAACGPGSLPGTGTRHLPGDIVAMVRRLAPTYGLDPTLVEAVVAVESAWRSDALSSADAAGLMQLMPETAQRFGVVDVFDPEQNLRGGMLYLQWLLAYFRGDIDLVLAAYNAGEGAVERHGGLPPFAETAAYVRQVRRRYHFDRHPFDAAVSHASTLVKGRQARP